MHGLLYLFIYSMKDASSNHFISLLIKFSENWKSYLYIQTSIKYTGTIQYIQNETRFDG
jgi:low affinity Fe/Cu permease